ncbi:MAG: hypothetical protein M0008_09725 [Actinomycetota bacterium]|nr:hypothetical protein [Actinomycetota bacterium]
MPSLVIAPARSEYDLLVVDEWDVLDTGELDPAVGLVGDNWSPMGNTSTPDGSANPDGQVAVMNYRCALLVAGSSD